MPPPNYHHKISGRSAGDHELESENYECNSKTESSYSEDLSTDYDPNYKKEGVGIVKSLLGPSLEETVLRTLEFGKYLIQKPDENESRRKKGHRNFRKEIKEKCKHQTEKNIWESEAEHQKFPEGRATRKRIVFTAKLDKDIPLHPNTCGKKPNSVSKIRSLDSDLKHGVTSPENIKKQLEALIQINKDEPPEHAGGWNNLQKCIRPVEFTVMPSVCAYRNEADDNSNYACDSRTPKKSNEAEQSSSRMRSASERTSRRRLGAASGIRQAPEFLSNALGPSLDVSLIENIKMMKDILRGDSGKGEGSATPKPSIVNSSLRKEEKLHIKKSPVQSTEIESKITELQRKVTELEEKERFLLKKIEAEEKERECKRKAFEEEEKKHHNVKPCMLGLGEEEKKKSGPEPKDFDTKYEGIKQRIACEEEKLSRLKDQYECYKREMTDAKSKTEALKRNKSLLDAWDVIASRVCHTRLPSFSRACDLERKQFKANEHLGDVHCCFLMPDVAPPSTPHAPCANPKSHSGNKFENKSNIAGTKGHPACGSSSKEHEPHWRPGHKTKHEEIPFPIQRDIVCGMHQNLKTCTCGEGAKKEGLTCSSDDELLKKSGARNADKRDCAFCGGLGTGDKSGKPPTNKPVCRSRSETAMRRDKCAAKIVKVMWAVTRINIFQDNCRTYEVMDATSTPPPHIPSKTEGIFVVKNPMKKACAATTVKTKGGCDAPGV